MIVSAETQRKAMITVGGAEPSRLHVGSADSVQSSTVCSLKSEIDELRGKRAEALRFSSDEVKRLKEENLRKSERIDVLKKSLDGLLGEDASKVQGRNQDGPAAPAKQKFARFILRRNSCGGRLEYDAANQVSQLPPVSEDVTTGRRRGSMNRCEVEAEMMYHLSNVEQENRLVVEDLTQVICMKQDKIMDLEHLSQVQDKKITSLREQIEEQKRAPVFLVRQYSPATQESRRLKRRAQSSISLCALGGSSTDKAGSAITKRSVPRPMKNSKSTNALSSMVEIEEDERMEGALVERAASRSLCVKKADVTNEVTKTENGGDIIDLDSSTRSLNWLSSTKGKSQDCPLQNALHHLLASRKRVQKLEGELRSLKIRDAHQHCESSKTDLAAELKDMKKKARALKMNYDSARSQLEADVAEAQRRRNAAKFSSAIMQITSRCRALLEKKMSSGRSSSRGLVDGIKGLESTMKKAQRALDAQIQLRLQEKKQLGIILENTGKMEELAVTTMHCGTSFLKCLPSSDNWKSEMLSALPSNASGVEGVTATLEQAIRVHEQSVVSLLSMKAQLIHALGIFVKDKTMIKEDLGAHVVVKDTDEITKPLDHPQTNDASSFNNKGDKADEYRLQLQDKNEVIEMLTARGKRQVLTLASLKTEMNYILDVAKADSTVKVVKMARLEAQIKKAIRDAKPRERVLKALVAEIERVKRHESSLRNMIHQNQSEVTGMQ